MPSISSSYNTSKTITGWTKKLFKDFIEVIFFIIGLQSWVVKNFSFWWESLIFFKDFSVLIIISYSFAMIWKKRTEFELNSTIFQQLRRFTRDNSKSWSSPSNLTDSRSGLYLRWYQILYSTHKGPSRTKFDWYFEGRIVFWAQLDPKINIWSI